MVLFILAIAFVQASFVIVLTADGSWLGWLAGSVVACIGVALADGHGYVIGYARGLDDDHNVREIIEERQRNGAS